MNNRRSFLLKSAAIGSSLPLFNIQAAGVSPNEKINHASFGGDGMAFADIQSLNRSGFINLVAVAEVDKERQAKVREAFPEARIYQDWRELLEKEKDLDSVNVSTPDHMHAPIGVTAMNLGLHVYGQKPLAHTLYETRRMSEIAKETGVVTQMGTQFTSSTYERLAAQMIQDGVIGKVKEVHMFTHKAWGDPRPRPDREDPIPESLNWDMWCGVGPKPPFLSDGYYHPGSWRCRLDYGTGTLGDMGCHLYSPMFAALGVRYPLSVKSTGSKPSATNWAVNEKFEYIFPGNDLTAGETVKGIWYDTSLRPPQDLTEIFGDQMPEQGSIFIGTEGILLQPHTQLPIPYPREKFADYRYPKIKACSHYGDFISAVCGEKVKPLANFVDYGGPLTETVLLGALSTHFPNETLEWDVKTLQFKNNSAANDLIRKAYRTGWEVKGLS